MVQELSPAQAECLSAVMPHGQLEPALNHTGMGIALRRPATLSRLSMTCRDGHIARLEPKHWPGLGRNLDLMNVHMAAPHTLRPRPGLWHRRLQMRDLMAYLEGDRPDHLVMMGDLNATPGWPLYRRIASQLTDAAAELARVGGRAPRATWGPWFGAPRLIRIDHAFVAGVEVTALEVLDVEGSDHSAVMIDLVPPG
jgi:endonuclease/exonuclease/phosphatase family metal-dependent hydrolase